MRRQTLILLTGLLLAACGGSAAPTDSAAEAPTPAAGGRADTAVATPTPAAPDADPSPGATAVAPFGEVTTVSGEPLDGADYAGQDLALWFWAPW